MGKELFFSNHKKGSNKNVYRFKSQFICSLCEHFGVCTTAKRGRSIVRLDNEQTKEQLAQLYEGKEGQKIYARRKETVELPFGHIKRNLGATNFLLRGINGAKAELSLLGSCFNIARMITLLGGVRPMVTKMQEIR